MQIQLILFLRTVVYQGCTFQTFNTFQASLCSRDGAKNKWCPLTQHPDSGSPRVRFRNPGFQHSFTVIQQAVRLGTALSNVLQSQPKVFSSNTDRLKSNKCFTRGGICKLRPGPTPAAHEFSYLKDDCDTTMLMGLGTVQGSCLAEMAELSGFNKYHMAGKA